MVSFSLSPADTEYWHGPTPDLQADAVRLCIALQGDLNSTFLGAAYELLSCGKLHPAEFRRHSRKIIRLIEAARERLESSGVTLFLFTSCQKGKWKDVYFEILRMLQARRSDVDEALQARTNSLLVRLSSNFVGRESSIFPPVSPAQISLPEASRRSLARGITTCTRQPPNSSTPCISMPRKSPDAFPPDSSRAFHRRKRPRRILPLFVPEPAARARKRARHGTDQENEIPAPASSSTTYPYKSPPLTRRFGIFCTAKSSMHRPQSVRAY
ncbi:hypothetical protein C8F04DRAFT_1075197 [Mycena alexandri]|uniref:Uncharacterized protein n=1 Tax=Mycena alexandri TaxID=1745969 RepID=A0AAD6TEL8_9AGAR|nr:hypothetical protein C8F04DRAFT_1075197 [Mycena alexandri]